MYRHTRHLMMYGIIGLLPAAPPFQTATAWAQYGHGSIVGWGSQLVGVDLSADFVAVAATERRLVPARRDGGEVDAARKPAGIVVAEASEAGLAPWSGQIGAIHGGRGRSRLNREGRLGTMAP